MSHKVNSNLVASRLRKTESNGRAGVTPDGSGVRHFKGDGQRAWVGCRAPGVWAAGDRGTSTAAAPSTLTAAATSTSAASASAAATAAAATATAVATAAATAAAVAAAFPVTAPVSAATTAAVIATLSTAARTASTLTPQRQFGRQHPVLRVEAATHLHGLTDAHGRQRATTNHQAGFKVHALVAQLQLPATEPVHIALQHNVAGLAQSTAR
eukprot:gene30203-52311_t